jgi:hypothetical protein
MPKKKRDNFYAFPITTLAGSSLQHFIRLRNDYSIDSRYLTKFLASIAVCTILEPFRWWEELRWRKKIKNTHLDHPPVFIIGFWRSGTTMLHELLCKSSKASYVTTYQTVFPHLLLSHYWWLSPLVDILMPARRPFDKMAMDLDYPQEEEIAMANIQPLSFYNFFYFPRRFEKFYHRDLFFDDATVKQIEKWKVEYKKLISKALIHHPGQVFISKNPSNMVRIKELLGLFPDAKFIFIYRNPYKVVESFYRFFQEVLPTIQLQSSDAELTQSLITKLYGDMIRDYMDHRELIPSENLMEIKFEDFAKDTMRMVNGIYDQFGLEGFENDQAAFNEYLQKPRSISSNHYEISRRTIDLVNENLTDLLKMWSYDVKD